MKYEIAKELHHFKQGYDGDSALGENGYTGGCTVKRPISRLKRQMASAGNTAR